MPDPISRLRQLHASDQELAAFEAALRTAAAVRIVQAVALGEWPSHTLAGALELLDQAAGWRDREQAAQERRIEWARVA